MRLVTIRAADTRAIHAALQERTPFVNLTLDLAIRMVATWPEQVWLERVQKRIVGEKALFQRRAPAMARGAHFDFDAILGVRRGASGRRRQPGFGRLQARGEGRGFA